MHRITRLSICRKGIFGNIKVKFYSFLGIYFKYDISAFKVIVNQDRESIWQFLLKLCSGVGGIFATSQIICDVLRNIISLCVKGSKTEEKEVDNLLSSAPS